MVVLVSLTCLPGRMGIRYRWVGGELFGVHWQRKQNQSMVGQEGHVRQEKKINPLGNRTPWWRTKVDMRKAV